MDHIKERGARDVSANSRSSTSRRDRRDINILFISHVCHARTHSAALLVCKDGEAVWVKRATYVDRNCAEDFNDPYDQR
jgi:hypothetical protein